MKRLAYPIGLSLALLASACVADDTDGPPLAAPEVIRVASNGTAESGAALATADQAASEASGDEMASSMMVPWTVITGFVAADSLPALPTDSTGWVHRAGRSVPLDTATRMAEVFGVDPTPVTGRQDADWTTYGFGPDDGSSPSLMFGIGAEQDWWFNSGWSNEMNDPCIEVETEEGIFFECPEPVAPTGVPTADEARERALELWRRLGIDTSAVEIEVWADEWYASVSGSIRLPGSPVQSANAGWLSVGFGANGVLEYASGTLSRPEPAGPYPLIGIEEALKRLSRYHTWPTAFIDDMVVAIDEPAPADETSVDAVDAGSSVSRDAAIEELGSDRPTEVVVTLGDVKPDLWWTSDVEGNVWLLPAYAFTGDDGGIYTVPAVTEEYLVEEIPVSIEPMPVEPMPVEPGTDIDTASAEERVERLLAGFEAAAPMALDEFTALAADRAIEVRVASIDGEGFPMKMDYRDDRVNIDIEADTVVRVLPG
ncbi:MAG: hypothetical protein ACO4A1_09825 [Ilumatobacteraceae bacterium]